MKTKYQMYERVPTGYGIYTYVKKGRAQVSLENLKNIITMFPYGGTITKQYTNHVVHSFNG